MTGCWHWGGNVSPKGYGYLAVNGKTMLAHRMAYTLAVGPIPAGMQIDHVCHSDNKNCPGGNTCSHRSCVNPEHLEAVSPLENTSRGRKKDSALDECKHGHKYITDNTRIDRRDNSRVCRTCSREKLARFRARHGNLNP